MVQKIADQISRFFVGTLLIFSGLIKLNDPVGTQIKMEEYFEVFANDFGSFFHYFIPWSLEIGFFLIVLEVVLGIAILIYWRMNIAVWALLVLILFFTFLTFYSAYFNKVTDCGCFGDAIKLTPWQSFTKDVVLMIFVAQLFISRHRYQSILRNRQADIVIVAVSSISFLVGIYAIEHLPFIDFRPYRVGNNIPQQMIASKQPIVQYLFEKNGEKIQSDKYITDSGYKYISSQIVNEDEIIPKITDYSVTTPEGEEQTVHTFQGNKLLIIISDVTKASSNNISTIRNLINELAGKVDCLVLTSSSTEEIEAFRHEHQLAVPYAFSDATVLKTIIRSNPGVCLWKEGTVLGNWHHNDTPKTSDILKLIAK